ncbi:carboxypeptidase-like regulatory domain-containing protein [Tenacibaculum piscium]|uniref:carboxypeptidase-like regulatory domain-containing protein n=1 Tax=Tenacibaculum piscium TaxID=1458515 RepID=UPI001F410F51|nr:carboxypeptidase-like regulatory domain-containing protein [Tenacibaculum piscium]
MKIFLTLIVSYIYIASSFAQVSGKIIGNNNNPLEDVNVILKGTQKGTTTNNKGHFQINSITKGQHTLVVSMLGYKNKEVKFTMKSTSKILPPIKLNENSNELSVIHIQGKRDKTKVTSSSLRLQNSIQKIPQNIQVVSDEILESQMIANMLDAPFKNVSGVTNVEHWGNFANLKMRGFRLPAFRNGVNIQDSWGPLSEDMFMVDKIEFVKGPSAFMLSAGEPGGLYNVVTKKPTSKKTGKISLQTGTQDTYRGAVDFGGKISNDERFLYRLNVMYQSRGTHRNHQKSGTRFGIAPALSYQITPKTNFLTEYSLQKVNDYIGNAYVFNTPEKGYASLDQNFSMIGENFPQSNMTEVSLLNRLTHNFNSNWSAEVKYVMMDYKQEGASYWIKEINPNGNVQLSASKSDAKSEGNYFQVYINGKFSTGNIAHKILGGFDFSEKRYWGLFDKSITPMNTFNLNNPTYSSLPKVKFNRDYKNFKEMASYKYGKNIRSYYLQDQVSMLDDKIRLTLAARYTLLDPIKSKSIDKITPRIGLSIDILPQLTAYGLFDKSFLPNNVDPKNVKPGTVFDPVEGIIYEAGLKSNLFNNKLKSTISYYQITKNNLALTSKEINPITSEPYIFPESEIISKGFEFDLQGKITDQVSLILNYANTNVEDSQGKRIAGHAKHITNGWFTYDFNENTKLKGFGVSLGFQHQVDRSTWAWAGADQKSDLPDYFRMDGAVTWKNDKWRVGLNINNLLDKYLYSGANYGSYLYWQSEPGINGRISLTYNLF